MEILMNVMSEDKTVEPEMTKRKDERNECRRFNTPHFLFLWLQSWIDKKKISNFLVSIISGSNVDSSIQIKGWSKERVR